MPRVYHSQSNSIANHSLYQTELMGNQHSTLKEIAANTKNINLNVDTLEVNTDTLEAKIAETNTKLAAQKTVLDAMLVDTDAIDSSCNTIEAQSVLTASRLNNIQNKISANVDGTGDTLGQINSNILTKNGEIESSLNSLISANHADLIALEASLTSMEGKQDSIKTAVELLDNCVSGTEMQVDVVSSALPSGAATQTTLASILAKNTEIEATNNANQTLLGTIDADTGAIKTAVELLDNCVSGTEMQVDVVSSALPSGAATQTTLASILAKNTEIEATNNANQTLLGTIDADTGAIKTAIEGTLTVGSHAVSNNGTFAVQSTVAAALPAGDNNIGNVDIVSSALPSGAATQTTLASILAKNTEIETTNNANQLLLGTIDADTSAIKTAIEGTLTVGSHAVSNNGTFAVQSTVAAALPAGDNNIGNVDIVSSVLPSGAATQTTLASILAKNTEIETTNNANQLLLGTIDADTGAIKAAVEGTLTVGSHAVSNNGTFAVQSTVAAALPAGSNRVGMVGMKANEAVDGSGTERFVLCDAAGHLQVDVLSGGSTDVSALSTHAKQDTIIGHLDGVEGKLDAIETTNNACQVLLGTIDSDTNAIKAAVEGTLTVGSHAVSNNGTFAVQSTVAAALPAGDNNIGNVDIVSSALPSGAATQTTLASILAKNTEIETTNNANQLLLGTIDADTGAIKTASEAIENAVHVDDAAYTLGTHSVMMMGGFAGSQSVAANDAGALAMTTTGFLKIVNPMTTTQIDDGKSVSAGASTTSSVLNVSHVPTGRITFVLDPAVISVGDIQIDSVQYSFDGTLYLQVYTEYVLNRDATGHKVVQVKDFFAPHFRIHFTNQSGGSNETNLDIWAVY